MSDIVEGIGTAIEGGLVGKAIEGPTIGGIPTSHGHFAEGRCLNCSTELIGEHCHVCGQQAHLHRTIGAFLHDLVHGALHLDGKTWRTLPLLFLKPGELTRRYIAGERVRFVSPMALFLFSIFLMFAVFQITGISAPTEISSSEEVADNIAKAGESANKQAAEARAKLEKELVDAPEGSPRRKEIEDELVQLGKAEDFVAKANATIGEPDSIARVGFDPTKDTSGVAWLDKAIEKWSKNPGLMLYKLQANFYKFSWLLIPLSLPFVWLLFLFRREYKGYDHAVFITYSLSFVTLLFIVLAILGFIGVGSGWIIAAAIFLPPVHMYKQMRQAYGLSRFGALWRLAAMLVFIVIVLVLFLQLLLILGLSG